MPAQHWQVVFSFSISWPVKWGLSKFWGPSQVQKILNYKLPLRQEIHDLLNSKSEQSDHVQNLPQKYQINQNVNFATLTQKRGNKRAELRLREYCSKCHWTVHFKKVNFMLCEFHFNERERENTNEWRRICEDFFRELLSPTAHQKGRNDESSLPTPVWNPS